MALAAYHSALTPPLPDRPRYARGVIAGPRGDSPVFVHDLFDGYRSEYDRVDVLYTDLPWAHGYGTFEDRAGIPLPRTYRSFLGAVGRFLGVAHRPAVLVTGKQSQRHLPMADSLCQVRLNGASAIALGYWCDLPEILPTTEELLALLLELHESLGDFCCGYGRSLLPFLRAGRRVVASDYNPACIGHILTTFPGAHPEDSHAPDRSAPDHQHQH
jgi:hypothetical protein